MTHKAVSFEKVFQWTNFLAFESQKCFTEMFHESFEKQFSWTLMLRYTNGININLLFHEIVWKYFFP